MVPVMGIIVTHDAPVFDSESRQVIIGRRQMSWQIHAVMKQSQNIDV